MEALLEAAEGGEATHREGRWAGIDEGVVEGWAMEQREVEGDRGGYEGTWVVTKYNILQLQLACPR